MGFGVVPGAGICCAFGFGVVPGAGNCSACGFGVVPGAGNCSALGGGVGFGVSGAGVAAAGGAEAGVDAVVVLVVFELLALFDDPRPHESPHEASNNTDIVNVEAITNLRILFLPFFKKMKFETSAASSFRPILL